MYLWIPVLEMQRQENSWTCLASQSIRWPIYLDQWVISLRKDGFHCWGWHLELSSLLHSSTHIKFILVCMFLCSYMYMWVQVSRKARKGCWIPWNWSCKWLWAHHVEARIKPGFSEEQPLLLTRVTSLVDFFKFKTTGHKNVLTSWTTAIMVITCIIFKTLTMGMY